MFFGNKNLEEKIIRLEKENFELKNQLVEKEKELEKLVKLKNTIV